MTDLSHRVKSFYQKRLLPAEMVSRLKIIHLAHTPTPRTYTTHTAGGGGPCRPFTCVSGMRKICVSRHTWHIHLHIRLAHTLAFYTCMNGLELVACLMILSHKVVLAVLLLWFHDTMLLQILNQIEYHSSARGPEMKIPYLLKHCQIRRQI